MRRLTTITNDLRNIMADLDAIASAVEDRPGMLPNRAHIVGQIGAAAGTIAQAVSRLDGVEGVR